jgi:hypothetical protein
MSLRSEVIRIFNELIGASKKISDLPALPSAVQNTDQFEVARSGTSYKATGSQLPSGGGSGVVETIVAGALLTVDSTDPANPIISHTGIVTEPLGGTNQSSYAQGDILYASSTNNLGKRNIGTVGQVLTSDGTVPVWGNLPSKVIQLAASDETTALTTGTAKITFRMPHALTLTAVRASLSTTQTSGSIFTVDINEAGSTILSTKLTIDNGEKTSVTATTPPVISDTTLADDAEITIDIDQVGDGTAKGLKITLIGT